LALNLAVRVESLGITALALTETSLHISSLNLETGVLAAAASDQFKPPAGATDTRHWQRRGG